MKSQSIIGIVIAVLGLLNLVLTSCGISPIPIDAEGISIAVSTIFALAGSAVTTWYNFSITEPAKVADTVGKKIASGELTVKQVLDAIEEIKKNV